jgi:alkylhydroperoxidase family enzyme
MSSLLDDVPGPPFVPRHGDEAMLREAKKIIGGVPGCIPYVTPVPWAFDGFVDVLVPPIVHAPKRLLELVPWLTSYESSCRHCYCAQRAFLRIYGYSDSWIERIEHDAQLADLDEERRPAMDLARRLARSNPRPARAERDAAARRYGDAATVELAFVVAGWCFATRVSTFLRLPPDPAIEALSRRWFAPLLRPVFWIVGKSRKPPRQVKDPLQGPFQRILDGMGDLPVTHIVRRQIDRALASPILPRRAKLLIFAVVGRSMPCLGTEAEATQLLAAEGLGAADVEEILKNLSSPKLDATEKLLIEFARNSVRYEFLEVQDRIERELVPVLTSTQLIEAVATAALANSVVRLAMLCV